MTLGHRPGGPVSEMATTLIWCHQSSPESHLCADPTGCGLWTVRCTPDLCTADNGFVTLFCHPAEIFRGFQVLLGPPPWRADLFEAQRVVRTSPAGGRRIKQAGLNYEPDAPPLGPEQHYFAPHRHASRWRRESWMLGPASSPNTSCVPPVTPTVTAFLFAACAGWTQPFRPTPTALPGHTFGDPTVAEIPAADV